MEIANSVELCRRRLDHAKNLGLHAELSEGSLTPRAACIPTPRSRCASKKYAAGDRNSAIPFWDDADVTSTILRRRGHVLREVEVAPDIFHPVSFDLRAFDGTTMGFGTALVRIPVMRVTGANCG